MSHRSPGHAAGQLDRRPNDGAARPNQHRTAASSGTPKDEQRRRSAAVPVGDEAARVLTRAAAIASASSSRAAARADLPAAQRHSRSPDAPSPPRRRSALLSGSGCPSGVGSSSARAPEPAGRRRGVGVGGDHDHRPHGIDGRARRRSCRPASPARHRSRVGAENTGASRVLAAVSRFTAITRVTSSSGGRGRAAAKVSMPLTSVILPVRTRATRAEAVVEAAVMGAGAWGTALAKVLADAGNDVTLWARRPELADEINRDPSQPRLPRRRRAARRPSAPPVTPPRRSTARARCCWRCRRRRCARNLTGWKPTLIGADATLVSLAKGIELDTLMRMSQVIVAGHRRRSRPGSRSSPGPIWPARSLRSSPRPRSSPAPTPAARWRCSGRWPPATSGPTPTPT